MVPHDTDTHVESEGEGVTERAIAPITHADHPIISVNTLLTQIRPHWKARSLIERVQRLVGVDPSSACQRLFNAAIHDLREKANLAGLDIARQAADLHHLPNVTKPEDIENYPTERLLDLVYRMGLLTRAEWRRLKRCYDIRRDLEHEDDEYEAQLEDCVYIFKTCIDVVLSRDPVQLLKVTDIKEVVEQAQPQFPEQQFLDDYRSAPDPRQLEIMRFLLSTSLDSRKLEVVQANAIEMMKHLEHATRNVVKIEIAKAIHERVGRGVLTTQIMRIATAAGVSAYLTQNAVCDYYAGIMKALHTTGHNWRQYVQHGAALAELEDVGGLSACPADGVVRDIVRWLALCYVGEPGGYGDMGRHRSVFYSDTAAPVIERLVQQFGARELGILKEMQTDKAVASALARGKAIAQRYEKLLDIAGDA
jgi:hypothetical protein